MQSNYVTERLSINMLRIEDADFIFKLVNTATWKKFIGERNVHNRKDAVAYIQKIMAADNINYWVVKLSDRQVPVGIVTFIKKDYLLHHDIGFAFLPTYTKQGYAFEAADKILTDILQTGQHNTILATTIKENLSSIQLLKKLGFIFEREMVNRVDVLQLYSIAKTK